MSAGLLVSAVTTISAAALLYPATLLLLVVGTRAHIFPWILCVESPLHSSMSVHPLYGSIVFPYDPTVRAFEQYDKSLTITIFQDVIQDR